MSFLLLPGILIVKPPVFSVISPKGELGLVVIPITGVEGPIPYKPVL